MPTILQDELLFWTDTLGLGVFAASGASTGNSIHDLAKGASTGQGSKSLTFGMCAVCGMFTATFGGVARDLLLGSKPRILHSAAEMYASPALFGGIAFTATVRCV